MPHKHQDNKDLDSSIYMDHRRHDTPGNSNWRNHVMKIPKFDSNTPDEWIIFVDLL